MASLTDPNEVRMTGENSFIRLVTEDDGPETTRASLWRVLYCPGGQGHALFLRSDLTQGQVRVYSDNIAVARWLQGELESMIFPDFADQSIPVTEAEFSNSGDGRSFWTETIESENEYVTMTWYDFLTPFVIRVPPGDRPLGVYSCFIPARRARLAKDGSAAAGAPRADERDGHESSSACLAWSETWVKPR